MISVTSTYTKVTPESAEHGNFSDHGFYTEGGYFFSIPSLRDDNLPENTFKERLKQASIDATKTFASVESAVDYLEQYGSFEVMARISQGEIVYTQVSPYTDYATCEETTWAMHVKADAETLHQLHEALKEKGEVL